MFFQVLVAIGALVFIYDIHFVSNTRHVYKNVKPLGKISISPLMLGRF